ncbi:MAG: GMC family oxidoreductase [Deltaproteobacteria bacterium]|nr:GMC family oxidoreductase [Deltaproteobacteria bacterium]
MASHEADVCIVGSGVSGALVAAKLASEGKSVILLETGKQPDRMQAVGRMISGQTPYQGSHRQPPSRSAGPDPFKDGLAYLVGGSTWHWVGTAMRLLPADFQMKTRFGVAVDWPFDYGHLSPFYDRAEVELGVAGDTSSEPGRTKGYPLPAFPRSVVDQVMARVGRKMGFTVRATPQARNSQPYRGRDRCCSSSTCHPVCPVAAKYDATRHLEIATGKGARILDESTATRVIVGADGRIERVVFRRPDRSGHEVQARWFVLACNAFQIARLLLLSRTDALPDGVANSTGMVGRHLMDHAITVATGLSPEPTFPGRGPRQTSHVADWSVTNDRRTRSGFNLEISNKQAYPRKLARDAIAKGMYGDELHEKVRRRTQHLLRIKALLETLPDPNNRVTLDERSPDRFGDPGALHTYDVGEYTRSGARHARGILRHILEEAGCEEIGTGGWNGRGMHISGTARMGTDRRQSVVDPTLRSHDHPNLYIAGSATFPTIGMCNPTVTVAAMAIRLGDELARVVGGSGA